MKKSVFLLATIGFVVACMTMTGCKTSKLPSDYQAYLAYQQQMQKGEADSERESKQPTRRKREVDECILLAQDTTKIRAYGVGNSFEEATALEFAEAEAVRQLASMMETSAEGARLIYRGNASKNLSQSSESRFESMSKQFFAQKVKNYRVIKVNLYDLSDGSIQCYVCVELAKSISDVANELANVLSNDEVLGIDFRRQQFIKAMTNELSDYKNRQQQ